jgi:hypothetical protein
MGGRPSLRSYARGAHSEVISYIVWFGHSEEGADADRRCSADGEHAECRRNVHGVLHRVALGSRVESSSQLTTRVVQSGTREGAEQHPEARGATIWVLLTLYIIFWCRAARVAAITPPPHLFSLLFSSFLFFSLLFSSSRSPPTTAGSRSSSPARVPSCS